MTSYHKIKLKFNPVYLKYIIQIIIEICTKYQLKAKFTLFTFHIKEAKLEGRKTTIQGFQLQ